METVYRGRHVGTIGRFTAFSFYANKNVTTGEGGMLDDRRRRRCRPRADAAAARHQQGCLEALLGRGFGPYEIVEPGYKYNMPDLTAALGLGQLRRVEENWRIRERLVALYNEASPSSTD